MSDARARSRSSAHRAVLSCSRLQGVGAREAAEQRQVMEELGALRAAQLKSIKAAARPTGGAMSMAAAAGPTTMDFKFRIHRNGVKHA